MGFRGCFSMELLCGVKRGCRIRVQEDLESQNIRISAGHCEGMRKKTADCPAMLCLAFHVLKRKPVSAQQLQNLADTFHRREETESVHEHGVTPDTRAPLRSGVKTAWEHQSQYKPCPQVTGNC